MFDQQVTSFEERNTAGFVRIDTFSFP